MCAKETSGKIKASDVTWMSIWKATVNTFWNFHNGDSD